MKTDFGTLTVRIDDGVLRIEFPEVRDAEGDTAGLWLQRFELPGHPPFLRITTLWVPPADRRRRCAHRLVSEALNIASELGLPVYLEALPFSARDPKPWPKNIDVTAVRAFYAAHGFVAVPGHPFAMRFDP